MHVNTLGANMVPPPGVAPAPSFPAAICLAGAPGSAELQTEKPLHPYQDYPHRGSRWRDSARCRRRRGTTSARQVLQEARGSRTTAGPKGGPQHHPPHRVIAIGLKALNEHVKRRTASTRLHEASVGRDTGCALCVFRMLAPKSAAGGATGDGPTHGVKGKGKRLGALRKEVETQRLRRGRKIGGRADTRR